MPRLQTRRSASSRRAARPGIGARLPGFRPEYQALESRALMATLAVPSAYPTIAAAVAAANPAGGDTIQVANGTYSVHNVVINKPLTLISQNGAASTFLTGDNTTTSEEGSLEVLNTTGLVTIGGVNQGFTFQNPVVRGSDSVISSLYITGNTAPVIVQYNSFVGLNGVGSPFDSGLTTYQNKAGGVLFIQNNDFSKMFQAMLLEVPAGGAFVQSNRFHDLTAQVFAGTAYPPEGIFALTYGGTAGNINGMTISNNDFRDFNGLAIDVSGGYSGQLPSQFSNVAISGNAITAIGSAQDYSRAGIILQNGADTAPDEASGGVVNSVISGNTISGAVPCPVGSIGVWVLGQNNNLTVQNNFISGLDRGITVQEQVTGAGFASGMTVTQNSFTGNTQSIQNDSANDITATRNYWGTNVPQYVQAQANGGVHVNYNPWIGSGTDTDNATAGFQPLLTNLYTDKLSISGPDSVVKNATYSLTLNNANYPNSPLGFPLASWVVNWGDGTGPQTFAGTSSLVSHVYTTPTGASPDPITATATDSNGNTYTVALATDTNNKPYKVPDANGNLFPTPAAIPVTVTNFATLQVTHFYKTPSGFSVRFSQPIDANTVHLYTSNQPGGTNTLGPVSATLTGAVSGVIGGSLALDADLMGFTFVKTSTAGQSDPTPLANDTYTVTLASSATTGIRTASGSLALDGDADGVAGTNYTTSFTVSNAARLVRIADFVRGPGQPVVVPAATGVGLPVTINNAGGVQTIMLFMHYDPTRLTIDPTNPVTVDASLPAGTQVTFNTSVPGLLEICLRSPSPLSAGAKTLVQINASVPTSAANLYTSKEVITLDQVSLLDGGANVVPATGDSGFHVVSYLGDVTGNGFITSSDITLLQAFILSQDTGFAAFKDADPLLIGDVTANGFITSSDITVVQRYILSQSPPQIPAIPPSVPVSVTGPDPRISIGTGLSVAPNGSVTVPVNFLLTAAEATGVQSFDLAISYDPSVFQVTGVTAGSLASTSGYRLLWSTGASPGILIISASRQDGPVTYAPGASETLAFLTLQALPGALPGASALNLLDVWRGGDGPRATMMNDGHLTLELVNSAVTVLPAKRIIVGGKTPVMATGAAVGGAGAGNPPATLDLAIDAVFGTLPAAAALATPKVTPAKPAAASVPPRADNAQLRFTVRQALPRGGATAFDRNRASASPF